MNLTQEESALAFLIWVKIFIVTPTSSVILIIFLGTLLSLLLLDLSLLAGELLRPLLRLFFFLQDAFILGILNVLIRVHMANCVVCHNTYIVYKSMVRRSNYYRIDLCTLCQVNLVY